jgi:GTP1/Obg family GTP-binding protein
VVAVGCEEGWLNDVVCGKLEEGKSRLVSLLTTADGEVGEGC